MTSEARRLSLFPDWEEKHAAEIEDRSRYPARLLQMWKVNGQAAAGVICKTCVHCVAIEHHTKRYYKCDLSKMSHGAGTDWRLRWPACGKYNGRKE